MLAARSYLLIRSRPRVPGTQALQALMALVIFWSGCLLVETSVTDIRVRTAALQLGYLAELLMPVTWFALAFCYTQRQMHVSPLTLNALCFVPLISVGPAISNRWHGLVWRDPTPPTEPGAALLADFGAWFMVQLMISAVMVVIATTILAYALAQASRQARPVTAVVLAPLLVAAAGGLSVARYNPVPGVDLASLGFAAAILLIHQEVLRSGVPAPRRARRPVECSAQQLSGGIFPEPAHALGQREHGGGHWSPDL